MSDLLNFYGDKSVDVKIEYVVESYAKKENDPEIWKSLNDTTVPFNAAILISNPNFKDIQTINGYPIDCHNTVWVKTTDGNRLYANLNINSVTL